MKRVSFNCLVYKIDLNRKYLPQILDDVDNTISARMVVRGIRWSVFLQAIEELLEN